MCGVLTVHCVTPDTYVDVVSAGVGAGSAVNNLLRGDFLSAAVDAGGALVDLAAAAVPGVPGGLSIGIQGARLASSAGDGAITLYRAVSPAEAADIAKTGEFRIPPGGNEGKKQDGGLGSFVSCLPRHIPHHCVRNGMFFPLCIV